MDRRRNNKGNIKAAVQAGLESPDVDFPCHSREKHALPRLCGPLRGNKDGEEEWSDGVLMEG